MIKKTQCIVKNEKFELASYVEEIPLNFVMHTPENNSGYAGYSFHISEKNIDVNWSNGTFQGNNAVFKYNGIEIKRINRPTLVSVADQMNLYLQVQESEIETMAEKVGQSKVDLLVKRIKELEDSKTDLNKKLFEMKKVVDTFSTTISELQMEIAK